MSNTNPQNAQEQWTEMVEQMNDAVAESVQQNMKAQAAFVESWADAVDDSIPEEDVLAEGFEGYNRAYEVWMDAAERMFERTTDAAQGEDVDPSEFRDIWLQSANEAFKEVMGTSAFAAANGQLVERMMDMRQQADDVSQETIAQLGFPTRDDMDEVAERLVEMERRQHAVEQKLDRVLDALEEQ
ncbi:poly(R)-hydroxyalkanoic acid synthase subunit PhaE [Haloarculaceae archaeon H-GB2-1]|nr:poly(R)-hydroxyalkanoic acid synthase subunit PhaE [Haloarculaceae archaeon H-GB1-1]MEA5388787.1 poly(R)-hydroxyalkanoic acid synthase subunit PhaE [Haloarculaceae archaeon H-GB11]MEA5406842.1 poly(R)-hydroxyalkanoic acid synthase subunit PhaE [Haloarculaceae archaeon H-GB2-1]